jgi:hypothetical protein
MTYVGVPDWQDPHQPQGLFDQLVTNDIAVGQSTSGSISMGTESGIYVRYMVICSLLAQNNQVTALVQSGVPGFQSTAVKYSNGGTVTVFPYSLGVVGQEAFITISVSNVIAFNPMNFVVFGCRSFPKGWTTLGYPPCENSRAANWVPVNGASTPIAAPATGRLLIGGIQSPTGSNPGGAQFFQLVGQVNAVPRVMSGWVATVAGAPTTFSDFGDGVLLDPNTGVTANGTGAPANLYDGTIYYDIVS